MHDNTLYYGDNLQILREHIADESIDLIYLDPPFNSNRNYNVLFKDESGVDSEAQITAFEDTWHWNIHTEEIYKEIITESPNNVSNIIGALRQAIGTNQMMAYLVMMTIRLVELHRALKSSGSLYLHCDPTASHYLKTILDAIFGFDKFRNEIVWRRTNAKSLAFTNFANNHDIIFRYTKSNKWKWNPQYTVHNPEYIQKFYKHIEPGTDRVYRIGDLTNPNKDRPNLTYEFLGVTRVWRWTKERMMDAYNKGIVIQSKPGAVPGLKRYLDEQEGNPIDDIWNDIPPIQAQALERLGYPTQKPLTLLERIIKTSSDKNDIILDPFCGCGTTIAAAEKLNRKWIGIDITHLSIALQKYRLKEMFPKTKFNIVGEPQSVGAANQLALDNRFQFEWWALSLVKAKPVGSERKKGSDKGIDGVINFIDDPKGKPQKIIIQVKSGKVGSSYIRDFRGTIERENAALGLFLTLEEPTKDMNTEAAVAGFYHSMNWSKDFPKIQILTIADLLKGIEPKLPPSHSTFKKAEKVVKDDGSAQKELEI